MMASELGASEQWPVGTLLHTLTAADRAGLLALGTERRVTPGDQLIRQGDTDCHVILLVRALVKVTATTRNGRSALLAIRISGDLVGEMSALNGRPRSATVTSCGDGVVHVIPLRDFQPYLRAHPEAAIRLAGMVAERLRWSNRRRIDFASYSVKRRLARVLSELALAHGRRSRSGIVIHVRLTQTEVATLCGAAEITVQKAMRELRSEGLISQGYGRITIVDVDALCEYGDLTDSS